jgi:hypothetical protein
MKKMKSRGSGKNQAPSDWAEIRTVSLDHPRDATKMLSALFVTKITHLRHELIVLIDIRL